MIIIHGKHGHLFQVLATPTKDDFSGSMGTVQCAYCLTTAAIYCNSHEDESDDDDHFAAHIQNVVEAIEEHTLCELHPSLAASRERGEPDDITWDWSERN